MTHLESPPSAIGSSGARDTLPLSLVNDHLYCPRRAALKVVEGVFQANEHTLRGDIVHQHTDLSGYEVVQGVTLLRAVPVFSDRLGLNGKCDVLERHPDGSLYPVEFKLGKRRKWQNDDAQLCAQALCLEEMLHRSIPRGAVYHADSKRRREVEFTPPLRALTEAAVGELHALVASRAVPRAEYRPACEECSLFDLCLPRLAGPEAAQAARHLFET